MQQINTFPIQLILIVSAVIAVFVTLEIYNYYLRKTTSQENKSFSQIFLYHISILGGAVLLILIGILLNLGDVGSIIGATAATLQIPYVIALGVILGLFVKNHLLRILLAIVAGYLLHIGDVKHIPYLNFSLSIGFFLVYAIILWSFATNLILIYFESYKSKHKKQA